MTRGFKGESFAAVFCSREFMRNAFEIWNSTGIFTLPHIGTPHSKERLRHSHIGRELVQNHLPVFTSLGKLAICKVNIRPVDVLRGAQIGEFTQNVPAR